MQAAGTSVRQKSLTHDAAAETPMQKSGQHLTQIVECSYLTPLAGPSSRWNFGHLHFESPVAHLTIVPWLDNLWTVERSTLCLSISAAASLSGASKCSKISLHTMSLHKWQRWPHRKTLVQTRVVRLLQADHDANDTRHKEHHGCYLHVAIASPDKCPRGVSPPLVPAIPLALRQT